MPSLGVRERTDGSVHIRPSGAVLLSVAVWALCGALALQAVVSSGWSGALLLPAPLLVCVLVWGIVWDPRVVVRSEGLEIRNVLHRWTIPFRSVADVRLGAMLRIVLMAGIAGGTEDSPRVITAWNAPGVGRDRYRDRLSSIARTERGDRAHRPVNWAERLRADQKSSVSAAVVTAWEDWQAAGPPRPSTVQEVRSDVRWGVILAVGTALVLVLMRIAL